VSDVKFECKPNLKELQQTWSRIFIFNLVVWFFC